MDLDVFSIHVFLDWTFEHTYINYKIKFMCCQSQSQSEISFKVYGWERFLWHFNYLFVLWKDNQYVILLHSLINFLSRYGYGSHVCVSGTSRTDNEIGELKPEPLKRQHRRIVTILTNNESAKLRGLRGYVGAWVRGSK